MRERQPRQRERFAHLERLRNEEEVALVGSVNDHASPRRQQQNRPILARHQQADSYSAAGAVQDKEGQSDICQPVAALGNCLAKEEQPEVTRPKGQEGSSHKAEPRGKRNDGEMLRNALPELVPNVTKGF